MLICNDLVIFTWMNDKIFLSFRVFFLKKDVYVYIVL